MREKKVFFHHADVGKLNDLMIYEFYIWNADD